MASQMNPSVSVITLGVTDYKRALNFYKKGLGWSTKATAKDGIAFFKLNGVVLDLYDKRELAKDASPRLRIGKGFSGITLAHNVGSKREVDEVFATALKVGAKKVKAPRKTFWGGYGGYFADPDGYLWEIVFNPSWKMDKEGSVILS